ncbi:MAG: VOC family protein [Ilumatobacter sp.]
MTTRFDLVTIDSPDTDRLASFWTAVLGLHEVEREDGNRWIVLASADGTRRIGFQRGSSTPGSIHLDLMCEPAEFDTEHERLVGLGAVATSQPRHEPYGSIVNLADPDGNPFDLCAYAEPLGHP